MKNQLVEMLCQMKLLNSIVVTKKLNLNLKSSPFHDPTIGNQMLHPPASILAIPLHQGMSNIDPPSDGTQNGSPDFHYCNGV